MYFIPYLFNHVYIFIGCIDFSSWLGLACIVLFLILTVHSYVAPTLHKFIYLFYYLLILAILELLPSQVGHFSEDVNAATALKISLSFCLMFCCVGDVAHHTNRHV